MSTKRKIPDDLTEMQDEISDMLLKIHKTEGAEGVRNILRMAVVNYIYETPVPGRHKGLQRVRLVNQLAEAITIPCHAHDTIL